MNINSLISSLLPAPSQTGTAPVAGQQAPVATASGVQFKAQFGQAVSALAALATAAGKPASSSSGPTGANATADQLTAGLQKKISDLLASGASIQDIVQQLAAALASVLAGHFGGDPAAIQSQLQAAFASALSPPGNGPPVPTADLVSTLAQRFRQIAGLAAGVIGETGQSNRLFAGSFSDAASTAGGQPAPSQATSTTTDSIVSDTSALLATLTASPGDGKTVASSAPSVGTNGATLLGRILARAQAASAPAVTAAAPPVAQAPPAASLPGGALVVPASPVASPAALVDNILAAVTAQLGQPVPASVPVPVPVPVSSGILPAAAPLVAADVPTAPLAAPAPAASAQPAALGLTATPLNPAVSAFLKSFSDALTIASGSPLAPQDAAKHDDGTATVAPVDITSAQAPTIGAFAAVAPAQTIDPLVAGQPGSSSVSTAPTPTPDQSAVIEQVLRGAFIGTNGPESVVRLKLVPESLGDVSVRLSINGNTVDARVIATTPAAHDALVAGQVQLTRALSDAGLKLTSFNVSLAGGFTSFQQQQQSTGQQPSFGRHTFLGDVDTSETEDPSLLAIPSFAPSTTTLAGWGAYNYLV